MKLLVATIGDFQLRVEDTRELVRSHGASVVRPSPWLGQKIAASQVEVLEKLSDKATQEDWDDTLKQADNDFDLARKAFASEYPPAASDDADRAGAAGADAVLPRARTMRGPVPANPHGQTAGLAPDEKPAAPGATDGPGGPKDTNVPAAKHHQTKKAG